MTFFGQSYQPPKVGDGKRYWRVDARMELLESDLSALQSTFVFISAATCAFQVYRIKERYVSLMASKALWLMSSFAMSHRVRFLLCLTS